MHVNPNLPTHPSPLLPPWYPCLFSVLYLYFCFVTKTYPYQFFQWFPLVLKRRNFFPFLQSCLHNTGNCDNHYAIMRCTKPNAADGRGQNEKTKYIYMDTHIIELLNQPAQE